MPGPFASSGLLREPAKLTRFSLFSRCQWVAAPGEGGVETGQGGDGDLLLPIVSTPNLTLELEV